MTRSHFTHHSHIEPSTRVVCSLHTRTSREPRSFSTICLVSVVSCCNTVCHMYETCVAARTATAAATTSVQLESARAGTGIGDISGYPSAQRLVSYVAWYHIFELFLSSIPPFAQRRQQLMIATNTICWAWRYCREWHTRLHQRGACLWCDYPYISWPQHLSPTMWIGLWCSSMLRLESW